MKHIFAGSVLAAQERNAGGLGLLVVVVLLAVSVGLFIMLSRSLRRMRANVASGAFRGVDSERAADDTVDPRQALRRRSPIMRGRAPVIDGEVVTSGEGQATLPSQPGPPAGH
ncbi:hypothetical protein MXD59_15635 [Frankia sp. Ag45/Mut15]|uniref:Secreted protein n=1 Tax=Frankia umida TaxID=573489 RepID=A0ABT0K069_9ACTN|nr:hypothetical protein [Frankia umida]MCK9877190.1 hypothetical protein [Frankia umida]